MFRRSLARLWQMLRRWPRLSLFGVVVIALFAWIYWPSSDQEYRTVVVTRGVVERTVIASGRVRPTRTVRIGAETSGMVLSVLADVNDVVGRGQLLAEVEPVRLEASARQAEAQVSLARATVLHADALIARSGATVNETRREQERLGILAARGFATARSLENAESAGERALADARAATAQAATAQAELRRALAQLSEARAALMRSRIVSPISGVIISRQVDPGQTLAASFQTPVLFEIAADLDRMQVEAQVNEADIAEVAVGQLARISVEAFPRDKLNAVVSQIRPQASDTNGIISYVVVIEVANRGRRLLPGMSANVEIVTARSGRVPHVPVSALNFRPPPASGGLGIPRVQSVRFRSSPRGGGAPVSIRRDTREMPQPGGGPVVWRIEPGAPRGIVPVPVRLGVRGDVSAEILGDDIKIGDRLAVGLTGTTD